MIVDPTENANAHREEHSDGCASTVSATISVVGADPIAPDAGPSLVTTLVTMIGVGLSLLRVPEGVTVTMLLATSAVAGTSVAEICFGVSARLEEAVAIITTGADIANSSSTCFRRWLRSRMATETTRLERDKAYTAYSLARS